MGQTSGEIKEQIDQQREQLGQNLAQLEQRVKETVDWRTQFEQRPMAGVGIAFGAGFLLSMLLPGGDNSKGAEREWSGSFSGSYVAPPSEPRHSWQTAGISSQPQSPSQFSQPPKPRSPEMSEIAETVENIKGALLGLAATRLRGYLAEAVPGFHEEYEEAAKKRGASSASRLTPTGSSAGQQSGWQQDVSGLSWQTGTPTPSPATASTTNTGNTPGTTIADTAIAGMNIPTAGDTTTHPDSGYRP